MFKGKKKVNKQGTKVHVHFSFEKEGDLSIESIIAILVDNFGEVRSLEIRQSGSTPDYNY